MYGPGYSLENHPGLNGETTKSELIIDNSLTSNLDVSGVLLPTLRVEIALADVLFSNVAFLVLFVYSDSRS